MILLKGKPYVVIGVAMDSATLSMERCSSCVNEEATMRQEDPLPGLIADAKLRATDRHSQAVQAYKKRVVELLNDDPNGVRRDLAQVLGLVYRWDDERARPVAAFRVGSGGVWLICHGSTTEEAPEQWYLVVDGGTAEQAVDHPFTDYDDLLLLIDKYADAL